MLLASLIASAAKPKLRKNSAVDYHKSPLSVPGPVTSAEEMDVPSRPVLRTEAISVCFNLDDEVIG